MGKNGKILGLFLLSGLVLFVVLIPALRMAGVFRSAAQNTPPPGTIVQPVTPSPGDKRDSLQLHTFPFATVTPGTPSSAPTSPQSPTSPQISTPPTSSPTNTPVTTAPTATAGPPGTKIPITNPIIGGPVQPGDKFYCIDDHDPDMCDDNSSHHVPKGAGGVSGSCGTVISQAHRLVNALPQYEKGLRDHLTAAVSNCGYSTGPAKNYVQTHFVIDAYNLAGLKALSKDNPDHVSPSGMFSLWQTSSSGYEYVPYSLNVVREFGEGKRNLTGCVMFLKTSTYHIGIVNSLELFTPGGDGVISILQSGTRMYVDRFPVVGWSIKNTSTNMTNTSGVAGFGCYK